MLNKTKCLLQGQLSIFDIKFTYPQLLEFLLQVQGLNLSLNKIFVLILLPHSGTGKTPGTGN